MGVEVGTIRKLIKSKTAEADHEKHVTGLKSALTTDLTEQTPSTRAGEYFKYRIEAMLTY